MQTIRTIVLEEGEPGVGGTQVVACSLRFSSPSVASDQWCVPTWDHLRHRS